MIDLCPNNMMIYSPSNIEVLLHYHTTPEVHPRIHAPAVADATKMFLETGCIEKHEGHENRYTTTPKGKAWVKALCNVRMPRETYVDEHGNILE